MARRRWLSGCLPWRLVGRWRMRRRDFGSVRTLPSGRVQARYTDPGGRMRAATFATKREASRWLAEAAVELGRGTWRDPDAGRVSFREYATAWLDAKVE